jgi:putative Holliday junction resolvase
MPATPDPPAAAAEQGNVLAFDYGTRLIGVAVGNRITASARALSALPNADWTRLDAIVAEWQPACFVVGLPLALDGGEQTMSRAAREFARMLEKRFERPVHLVDERHTSGEAARRFADQRARGIARRKDAAAIDALAAAIILEGWLAGTGAAQHSPREHDRNS